MAISEEQQKFIDSDGKIILSACPGSGKTYTVTHKFCEYVKEWNEKHTGVAVLTFTNIAKDEIKNQIIKNSNGRININAPHYIGTIDSFFNKNIFLRYAHLIYKKNIKPCLIYSKKTLQYKWRKECYQKRCVESIQDFRWGIDNKLYKNDKKVECEPEGNKRLPCDQYKRRLISSGLFYQNDVSYICVKILEEYPQIAELLAIRYPIILLDEAQDTSKEQMAVFDLLEKGGVKTFCIIGDPDQAIYEWRNASSSCFMEKTRDRKWKRLYLNENRRSSQHICNATKNFSKTLENKEPNIAVGDDKDFFQKPELILVPKYYPKEQIEEYFLKRCNELNIKQNGKDIAILTRGKTNKEINGLWKSNIIEKIAKASYEWEYNSKREAYKLCYETLYEMIIGDLEEVEREYNISKKMQMCEWREMCFELMCNLPSSDLELSEWVEKVRIIFTELDKQCEFRKAINDVIKIKEKDMKTPDFKSIKVREFLKKRESDSIIKSTVHGVKGETFEAVLLYATNDTGNTITRKNLTKGDLENENNKIAYVAMTRPKKYLAVVLNKPKDINDIPLERFPYELWNYIEL